MPQPAGRAFARGDDPRRGKIPPKAHTELTLPAFIRSKTRKCRELVELLLAIARGEAEAEREVCAKDGAVVTLKEKPSHRDRLTAIRELFDRGHGSAIPADKMPEPTASEKTADKEAEELARVISMLPKPPPPPQADRGGDAGGTGDGNGGAA